MKLTSKTFVLVPCLMLAGLVLAAQAQAATIAYPTKDSASFMIDAPDDWELTPAEEEGDYFAVTGPTGVELWFRTIEGNEGALKGAIEESIAYLKETYSNVQLGDAKDSEQKGLKGFYATGSGKDKESGDDVAFGLAWYALKDDSIGEIWFVAEQGDTEGAADAAKVLDSFRAP